MVDSPSSRVRSSSLMPRSKSVLKRQRQNERGRLRNKAARSSLKTRERRLRSAADASSADTELRSLQRDLDRSAAKGAIHPNKAARKKSRLAKAARRTSA